MAIIFTQGSKMSSFQGMFNSIAALLLLLATVCASDTSAKSYDLGTDEAVQYTKAKVLDQPRPVIPSEYHENCFKSCCMARFVIDPTGKTKVKLLTSSGSDEIDDITLQTLRRWKFQPAMLDGKPVSSTRRIKVEFQID